MSAPCFLLCACFLFNTFSLYAQHEYSNWVFGSNAAITFITGTPTYLPGSQMWTNEGSASMSDEDGNLLFYSNGNTIWDATHTVMPNGYGLNGGISCTQAALAVPHPGNPSRYYLFTPPEMYDTASLFCYSTVDMTLNGGLGDIVEKNTPLFSPSAEKVTATRHANGTDYWVIAHSFGNADFYAYRVGVTGIDTVPVISTVGTPHAGLEMHKIGEMKASPCGDKIALVVHREFSELFDFNNATGVVSHAIHLDDYDPYNEWGVYGVGFSHKGTKLYVTEEHPAVIVQFNLLAGSDDDIVASADTVYCYMNTIGSLQNGPKGKTYVTHPGGYFSFNYLGCINYSDSLGDACNYVDTAFVLDSGIVAHCLPNFVLSGCEGTPTDVETPDDDWDFHVYPNPTGGDVSIAIDMKEESEVVVEVVDVIGQSFYVKRLRSMNVATHHVDLDLGNASAGVYFVRAVAGEKTVMRKLIKAM